MLHSSEMANQIYKKTSYIRLAKKKKSNFLTNFFARLALLVFIHWPFILSKEYKLQNIHQNTQLIFIFKCYFHLKWLIRFIKKNSYIRLAKNKMQFSYKFFCSCNFLTIFFARLALLVFTHWPFILRVKYLITP
jgi:hypothetical protein